MVSSDRNDCSVSSSKQHMRRVVLLLLLAMPMLADTTVTLERGSAPVPNGEVCRFRAGDAKNPFRRWLTSDEVTCVAAGQPIAFPAGLWNVFGKVEGKALSAPIAIEGIAVGKTLTLQLDAAATLLPQLPAGHSGLVYAPRRNTAVPIAGGSQRVTVPASEELWLLVVAKSRSIASIVLIPALAPESERAVDARVGGVPSSVIGWMQMPEVDRAALKEARDVSSPRVRLIAAGPALDSDPLPAPTLLDGSFFLVRGVSAGEVELRLEGRGWLPHTRRVRIADRTITMADQPLLARGAASLLVSWNSADDLPALDRSLGACDINTAEATEIEVSVAACAKPEPPGKSVDPVSCKVIRQESFLPQIPHGSFAVDHLPPGHYRAEMRFGKLPPIGVIDEVEPFQQQPVFVRAAYDTFYGSLTHGGEPLDEDTTLAFADGGLGFAPRETGEYVAVAQEMHGGLDEDLRIDIVTCDQRLRTFVLTDQPIRPNTRYDIDIPENEIVVNVTDTFTRLPLRAATLRYIVMSGRTRRPVVTQNLDGKGESQFILEAVPERQILLSVKHAGYQEYRVPPFTMGKSEKKTIDVQLVPLRGTSGRIISSRPFESGTVLWLSPTGALTERAELAPDGTFIHANTHTPDETMAVVSLSHPLWVLRMPAVDRRESLEMRFPHNVPARSFDVSLKGPDRGVGTYIGLVIGGVLVPQAALRAHQTLRDLPADARFNRPMPIRDIAETGPIDVLLGPAVNDVATRGRPFDPFLIPQTGETPRQRLTAGMTEVVFAVK